MTAELVCAATDLAWPQVRTQMSARKGHPARYGYVITEADGSSWVSAYRWHTAEAAQRAGEADRDRWSKIWWIHDTTGTIGCPS